MPLLQKNNKKPLLILKITDKYSGKRGSMDARLLSILCLILTGCMGQIPEESSLDFCPFSRLSDGSCPSSASNMLSWNFSDSSKYSFDSNYVSVSGGKAQVAEVKQISSGPDFNDGTNIGTQLNGSNNLTINTIGDYSSLSANWTPAFSDLVGYWPMEGDFNDASGAGNNATVSGDISLSAVSKVGSQSASFDGSSDYLGINNAFAAANNEGTLSCWLYNEVDSIPSNDRIILRTYFNGVGDGIFIRFLPDNSFNFSMQANSVSKSINLPDYRTYFPLNQWTHFTASWSNSIEGKMHVYINGRLVGEENQTELFTGALHYARLGFAVVDRAFKGKMDDCALWSKSLASADISLIYHRQKQKFVGHYLSPVIDISTEGSWSGLEAITPIPFEKDYVTTSESGYGLLSGDISDGLVGYWPLNESLLNGVNGSDFEDKSFHSNHLDEVNGVSNNREGILSQGIFLDGINDYVEVAHSPNLSFGANNDFSVSIWAKSNPSDEVYSVFIGKKLSRAVARKGYQLRLEGNNAIAAISDATNQIQLTSGSSVADGYWHQIVVTFDRDGSMSLYIDGESDAVPVSISTIGDIDDVTADLVLGSIGYKNANYHEGSLDEVAIWSRVLTATEVKELYRRNANRIKYQVRSCDDALCDTEVWIGPDGTSGTFFSEHYNNDVISGIGEPVGDPITTSANFSFGNYVLAPSINRYFQYRSILESEENLSCGGSPCLPELTSIEVFHSTRYHSGTFEIVTNEGISYSNIHSISFSESGTCTIEYQLSNNGVDYYYWNGTTFALVGGDADRNLGSIITANISSFASQVGTGSLQIRAFLTTTSTQSCSLSNIGISVEE